MRRLLPLLLISAALSGCGLVSAMQRDAEVRAEATQKIGAAAESTGKAAESLSRLLLELAGVVALASTWGKSAFRRWQASQKKKAAAARRSAAKK